MKHRNHRTAYTVWALIPISIFIIIIFLYKNISPLQKTAWNWLFLATATQPLTLKYISIYIYIYTYTFPFTYCVWVNTFSNPNMSQEAVCPLCKHNSNILPSHSLKNIFFLGWTQARKCWIPFRNERDISSLQCILENTVPYKNTRSFNKLIVVGNWPDRL